MEDFFFEVEAYQAEKEIWVAPEVIASAIVPVAVFVIVAGVIAYHILENLVRQALLKWVRPQVTAPPEKISFVEKRAIARDWDKPSL